MPANHYKRPDGKRPRRYTKKQILNGYAMKGTKFPLKQETPIPPPDRSPIEQAIIDGRMSWDSIGLQWQRLLFHPVAMHCGYGDESMGTYRNEHGHPDPQWSSWFAKTGERYQWHPSEAAARLWIELRAAEWLAEREASDGVR